MNVISIEPALKYINYETDGDDEGFLEKHPNLRSILPKLDELRERRLQKEVELCLSDDTEYTQEELCEILLTKLNERKK